MITHNICVALLANNMMLLCLSVSLSVKDYAIRMLPDNLYVVLILVQMVIVKVQGKLVPHDKVLHLDGIMLLLQLY